MQLKLPLRRARKPRFQPVLLCKGSVLADKKPAVSLSNEFLTDSSLVDLISLEDLLMMRKASAARALDCPSALNKVRLKAVCIAVETKKRKEGVC